MLLKRIRQFTEVLQEDGGEVSFRELCEVLTKTIPDTSVYLLSRRGKLLGYGVRNGLDSTPYDEAWLHTETICEEINSAVLKMGALGELVNDKPVIELVAPVIGHGRRVATLLFVREEGQFDDDTHILAEIAATTIGIIISHAIDEEEEDEAQESRIARSAIKSLSYSEILAMQHIFDELQDDEGLLVASRIADDAGITRSVIVNALRKLASANVIESRSLGMKGTYLRIINKEIRGEFEKQRYPYLKASERKSTTGKHKRSR